MRWRVCADHPHPEYMVEGAVTMPLDGQVVLACGPLPGGEAKRFRMGAAVVLGQNVAEAARPVGHGLAADLAACHRKMGHGHREAARTRLAHLRCNANAPGIFPGATCTRPDPMSALGG